MLHRRGIILLTECQQPRYVYSIYSHRPRCCPHAAEHFQTLVLKDLIRVLSKVLPEGFYFCIRIPSADCKKNEWNLYSNVHFICFNHSRNFTYSLLPVLSLPIVWCRCCGCCRGCCCRGCRCRCRCCLAIWVRRYFLFRCRLWRRCRRRCSCVLRLRYLFLRFCLCRRCRCFILVVPCVSRSSLNLNRRVVTAFWNKRCKSARSL